MYCSACGTRNDDDARFCERCGADLRAMPRPANAAPPAAPPAPDRVGPGPPPVVYPPARPRAWWYPIGVWLILSAFFLFVDVVPDGRADWSYWPIGILGIFMVGLPLLRRLEQAWMRPRGPSP